MAKSWDALSLDVIRKSFKCCGLSVAVDGLEDDEIHYTKAGEVAELGRQAITSETEALFRGDTPTQGPTEEDTLLEDQY